MSNNNFSSLLVYMNVVLLTPALALEAGLYVTL